MLTNYADILNNNHSLDVHFNQRPNMEELKCPSLCICHQYKRNLINYLVTDCSEINLELIIENLSSFTTHL